MSVPALVLTLHVIGTSGECLRLAFDLLVVRLSPPSREINDLANVQPVCTRTLRYLIYPFENF